MSKSIYSLIFPLHSIDELSSSSLNHQEPANNQNLEEIFPDNSSIEKTMILFGENSMYV